MATPPTPSTAGAAPRVPTLFLLACAGFVSMLSSRLCDAMLPALAATFSTTTAQAASVVTGFALAYGALQFVAGPLGDRHGKPRVVALACLFCALTCTAAAFATSLSALTLARAAIGAGSAAIVPLVLAWIGDTVAAERRYEALARYSSATIMGTLLGAWAGGALTQWLGWRAAFASVAPAFAAVGLVLLSQVSRQAREGAGVRLHVARPPYRAAVRALLALPWARHIYLVVMLEGLLVFGALTFVPSLLHAQLGIPLSQAGAVVALYGLGGLAYSRAAPYLLRRLPPRRVAHFGALLMGLGLLLIGSMGGALSVALACALTGFGFFAMHNTLQFQATQLAPQARGLALSFFAASFFFGQSMGVPLAGWTLTHAAATWTYGGAALALVALGTVYTAMWARQEAGAPPPP
jgi:predicted MFS family arabinose efflux permease